jgi:predicted DNA-binding protein
MEKISVIKTECNPDFKKKVKEFSKKKGETESAIIRKAVLNYINNDDIKKAP